MEDQSKSLTTSVNGDDPGTGMRKQPPRKAFVKFDPIADSACQEPTKMFMDNSMFKNNFDWNTL